VGERIAPESLVAGLVQVVGDCVECPEYGSGERGGWLLALPAQTSLVFDCANFDEGAVFLEAKFVGAVSFYRSTFYQVANFTRATFAGRVTFHRAHFWRQVFFSETIFGGKATFSEAMISTDITMVPSVVFDGARFEDAASFRNISVTDAPVTFSGTTFAAANFDNAVFEKGVAGLSSASTADRISRIRGHDAAEVDGSADEVAGEGDVRLADAKSVRECGVGPDLVIDSSEAGVRAAYAPQGQRLRLHGHRMTVCLIDRPLVGYESAYGAGRPGLCIWMPAGACALVEGGRWRCLRRGTPPLGPTPRWSHPGGRSLWRGWSSAAAGRGA
jgi:hypothetical protein